MCYKCHANDLNNSIYEWHRILSKPLKNLSRLNVNGRVLRIALHSYSSIISYLNEFILKLSMDDFIVLKDLVVSCR